MGNQGGKVARQRNSYSFDAGEFSNFKTDKILPLNISNSKFINRSSLEIKQSEQQYIQNIPFDNKVEQKQLYSKPTVSLKQQNAKLQKLTKNNDELRKQLIEINKKLSEELKKKKVPALMSQHHQQSKSKSRSISKEDEKKDKIKVIAIKKQLQNAYNQITRYQKQIEQNKQNQSSAKSDLKIVAFQDKIHQIDKQISQKTKEYQSIKSIIEKQTVIINQAEEQLNSQQINDSKKQIQKIKEKLKILKEVSRKKQKDEKVRHQTLMQLERKLRQINGEYMPQFKNYSLKDSKAQQGKVNLKENNFHKKGSSNNLGRSKQFRYLPSSLEIEQVQKQLQKYKEKHEEFHKKIDTVLKRRNQLKQEKQRINDKIFGIQKNLENLLYKKQRYTQLIMGSIDMGGSFQDNLSDDGIEENNEQNLIKLFGSDLQDQKQITDEKLFNKVSFQHLRIVTVNVWLNPKNQIVSIQFYYTDNNNFIVGNKMSQNKNIEEKKVFELEEADHLRNVMGIFNTNTKFLQFLVLESMKGKVQKFGKQIMKGENFNFRIAKKQRPTCFSGACTFDGSYWRINKFSFQIKNF